jgi:two-component system, NtrC family, sensor histidine kinase HydH
MSDDVLTNRVLIPLEASLADNRQSVAETNRASQATAQHLKVGFMLLGICGAVAGLLLGTVIARAISRSIVQLNVTVRSVAGRLSDVTGPVTFSHSGDLTEIDTGLRELEQDIEEVVERLQQRETELLRSEQLAKVGQLAAGVAHELRNPLMPMKILVQAALERNDGVGLNGRSLQVIDEEITRLEQSIQGFLDYARPPLPDKAAADLREIVTGTAALVTGRAEQQGVEIQIQLPEQEVLAEVDRGQIRQLLLNLFLNAIDALPSGGTIRCAMHLPVPPFHQESPLADEAAEAVAHSDFFNEHDALRVLTALPPRSRHRVKKWVTIHVADNGPGIPHDSLASVFEPFVTTKETGTGLGLSICRRIAAAHDGQLTVRNLTLGGAEFTLRLPRSS